MKHDILRPKRWVHSILEAVGIQATRISPYTNDKACLSAMLRHARVDLILDVGANVGQYAKERIGNGYDGRIVSFEPLSAPRLALIKEASLHPNWTVAPQCALGDHEEMVTMHISENSVASSLLPATQEHLGYSPQAVEVATESVKMLRLDIVAQPFLTTCQSPFLKIDVQGFEEIVLAGATGILPKIVGLQMELSFIRMYQGQKLFPEMLSIIVGMGFTLHRMIPAWVDRRTGRWLQMDGIFFRESIKPKVERR